MSLSVQEAMVAVGSSQPRPVLTVSDLVVRYESDRSGPPAVDGVGFTIAAGERVALVGESGSGKTTLALAVAGLLTVPGVAISATQLEFLDVAVRTVPRGRLPRRTDGIAMVFQDAMVSLDPVWRIGSQLTATIRARHKVSRSEARGLSLEWLHKVGLDDGERILRARPYELSGGMRQRVMMAIALSGGPRLLIADEPTSALDASLSREVMDLLLTLTRDLGTALLIVSHDIDLCREYSDRTMVMYRGRIVDQGASDTLPATAVDPYTRGLLQCVPRLDRFDLDELPTLDTIAAAEVHDAQDVDARAPHLDAERAS